MGLRNDIKSIFIALDDLTIARLIEIADACHAQPEQVAAAIIRDVLEDDALAHERELIPLH